MQQTILILLVISTIIPLSLLFSINKSEKVKKRTLKANLAVFFTALAVGTILIFSGAVFAEGEAAGAASASQGIGFIAAALATGLATIGAGIAVASASSAALGALSENEKIMGKALIFVALAEGIALYGLLVSFSILGRL